MPCAKKLPKIQGRIIVIFAGAIIDLQIILDMVILDRITSAMISVVVVLIYHFIIRYTSVTIPIPPGIKDNNVDQ